jgi:hypothetical protein
MAQDISQVQRTGILDDIQERLHTLENMATAPAAEILNIYGISGLGKTYLIHQVFERFKQDYSVIWLDFDTNRSAPVQPEIYPLDTVVERLRAHIDALEFLPDTVATHGNEYPTAQYQVRFDIAGLAFAESRPILLLLDHLDELDYWKWAQAELIEPLIEQQTALVLCVSQSPLFWNFWELRERCTLQVAEPFSEAETEEYFRQHGRALVARSAQEWARGYPLQLDQIRPLLLSTPQSDTVEEPVSMDSILEKLSPEARVLLPYIGLLRRIEVPVVVRLVQELQPADLPNLSTNKLRSLLLNHVLPELNHLDLMEGYSRRLPQQRLRLLVRRALEAHMQTNEPDLYRRIYATLARLYANQFWRWPIDEMQALGEWLLFSTVPLQDDQSEAARHAWLQELERLFERAVLVGRKLAVALYRDREVMNRLQELDLLIALQEVMHQQIGTDDQAPPILNETELEQYRRDLIEHLSEHPQLCSIQRYVPGGLFVLLQTISSLDFTFDLQTLRQHLNERVDVTITPGAINTIVALLQSCGFLTYDREQRRYQLTSQIVPLLAKVPPAYHNTERLP